MAASTTAPETPQKLINTLFRTVIEQGFAPGIDAILSREWPKRRVLQCSPGGSISKTRAARIVEQPLELRAERSFHRMLK